MTPATKLLTLAVLLPLAVAPAYGQSGGWNPDAAQLKAEIGADIRDSRSEEHTSELQSPVHLVCRLLLEKKKKKKNKNKKVMKNKGQKNRNPKKRNQLTQRGRQGAIQLLATSVGEVCTSIHVILYNQTTQ